MEAGRSFSFAWIYEDESMLKDHGSMMSITEEDMPRVRRHFQKSHIPYVEVDILVDF